MEDVHRAVAARLQRSGSRYTASRRAVIEALMRAGQPQTLPDILAAQPALAQSSAYRNLAELESAGVVRRIITSEEHSHFELAEDLTGHHHHHLICSECGSVEDVAVPPELEALIDRSVVDLGRDHEFSIDGHRLDLIGRCARCRGGSRAAPSIHRHDHYG